MEGNRIRISKRKYDFFLKQIARHKDNGIINQEQMIEIIKTYDVKEGPSFIQVLLTLGAILTGLGVLSFIASNWIYIGKVTKFLLILVSYLTVNIVSFRTQERYPKTSLSLLYLGILIYGAGIFLVGQMFHFGGHFTNAFLLWAIGIIPLIFLTKDKWIFIFLHILLFVYLNGHYTSDILPYILLFIIPLLYVWQKLLPSKWILFLTNILTLNFIWFILDEAASLDVELVLIIFFILGILMYFVPIRNAYLGSLIQLQGNIIFGITGIVMTNDFVWYHFEWIRNSNIPIHIIFAVLLTFLLLFLVRQKNLLSLIFIGLIILRFYFDTLYDFLPKSIFFIIGGLILLGFGYYFERKRRKIWGEEK